MGLTLKQRFMKWARKAGHTQTSAADAIGIGHVHLNKILNRTHKPGVDVAMQICQFTGQAIKIQHIYDYYMCVGKDVPDEAN